MEVIGLSGYARSGKDEAAKALAELGYRRVSFADKLREVLYQLNPWVHENYESFGSIYHRSQLPLQDVIDKYGWNGYKETMYAQEIRRLLQRLGTEAGREALWDSIWVDAAFATVKDGEKIVVTDCRFPNEAQGIKDRGGVVWRIKREGIGPANDHPSETSLDDWPFDAIIENTGTLEEYHEKVQKLIKYGDL